MVKLIDIYPEDTPPDETTKQSMGGYQLMIAGEILRGRCRTAYYGAGAEHVVSALRPKPPAVRAQHNHFEQHPEPLIGWFNKHMGGTAQSQLSPETLGQPGIGG